MAEEHKDSDLPCSKEPEEKIHVVSPGTIKEKTEASGQTGRTDGSASQTSSGKPRESASLVKSETIVENLTTGKISQSTPLSPDVSKSPEKKTKLAKSVLEATSKSFQSALTTAGSAVASMQRSMSSIHSQETRPAVTSSKGQCVKAVSKSSSGFFSGIKHSVSETSEKVKKFMTTLKPKKEEKQALVEERETEPMDTEMISRQGPSAAGPPKKEKRPQQVLSIVYKTIEQPGEETLESSLDTTSSEGSRLEVESRDIKPGLLIAELATGSTSSVATPSREELGGDMLSQLQVVQKDDDETGTRTTSVGTTPSEEVSKQSIESFDAEAQRSGLSSLGSSDVLADVSSMESESPEHEKKALKKVRPKREGDSSDDDAAGDVKSPRKRRLRTRR